MGYAEKYNACSPGIILNDCTIERAFRSSDTNLVNCLIDLPWHYSRQMEKYYVL